MRVIELLEPDSAGPSVDSGRRAWPSRGPGAAAHEYIVPNQMAAPEIAITATNTLLKRAHRRTKCALKSAGTMEFQVAWSGFLHVFLVCPNCQRNTAQRVVTPTTLDWVSDTQSREASRQQLRPTIDRDCRDLKTVLHVEAVHT